LQIARLRSRARIALRARNLAGEAVFRILTRAKTGFLKNMLRARERRARRAQHFFLKARWHAVFAKRCALVSVSAQFAK
jgi:hypothetical protein